eukprot:6134876-Pyramimonas_sp.AAC.1
MILFSSPLVTTAFSACPGASACSVAPVSFSSSTAITPTVDPHASRWPSEAHAQGSRAPARPRLAARLASTHGTRATPRSATNCGSKGLDECFRP